ncbi:MAG: TolC family protein [Clostridia bacterium]
MKKILIFLLIVINLVTMTSVFADATVIRKLTLEEAQTLALNNNLKFSTQGSYINDAVDDYKDQEDANEKLNNVASTSFFAYFNKPINLDVSLESAANKIKLEKFKKEDLKRVSDYNVKAAFINIKKAQYALEDAKNDIYLKLKDYEVAKIKQQLELITEDNLKQYEKSYKAALTAEESALKKLHEEIQKLNKYIGRELTDYDLELVMNLSPVDINTIDITKIKEDYLKSNDDLYSLSLSTKLAETKYDLTKERYDHFVKDLEVLNSRLDMEKAYDQAERDYNNAKKALDDATKDIDINLNSTYNTLKTASETVDRLIDDVEDTKRSIEIDKIRYNNNHGSISKNDYEKSQKSLDTIQNKLDSAIADMNLLYSSLTMYSDTDTK